MIKSYLNSIDIVTIIAQYGSKRGFTDLLQLQLCKDTFVLVPTITLCKKQLPFSLDQEFQHSVISG